MPTVAYMYTYLLNEGVYTHSELYTMEDWQIERAYREYFGE